MMACALAVTRVVAVFAAGCVLVHPSGTRTVYEHTSTTVKQQLAQEYSVAFASVKP